MRGLNRPAPACPHGELRHFTGRGHGHQSQQARPPVRGGSGASRSSRPLAGRRCARARWWRWRLRRWVGRGSASSASRGVPGRGVGALGGGAPPLARLGRLSLRVAGRRTPPLEFRLRTATPDSMNAQVSSRTRASCLRVRLETCAFTKNEPFSPGGHSDWRGSARYCGKDGCGVVWRAQESHTLLCPSLFLAITPILASPGPS